MSAIIDNTSKNQTQRWYRIAYGAFILLALYFLIVSKDFSLAVSNLGIALVFDPFDQRTAFGKRPTWQKIWLLVHVSLVLAGFGWMIFK